MRKLDGQLEKNGLVIILTDGRIYHKMSINTEAAIGQQNQKGKEKREEKK